MTAIQQAVCELALEIAGNQSVGGVNDAIILKKGKCVNRSKRKARSAFHRAKAMSHFEGSGRSEFKAASAVFTDVVEVKELRLTSEIGTPNSTMRTTELGFAASDGA